ncbi:AraC family transcriptional regulator [Peribacillus sp. SCS-155]|uniref:AraC family transcriptional regulator n=1 Tax=Peribacillus sedimenti TaxID=3115297 RepID=UPI003905FE71
MQQIVDYIEENLHEQVTLEGLAKLANFSPFHFHRVFQAMVGESVMDYVRKRRLTRAAERLYYSGDKVIDIAFDTGFQYQESFNRSFKKLYGVSPKQYRDSNRLAGPLIGKACLDIPQLLGGNSMEPKVITKPAFHVIGFELETRNVDGQNNKDIPEFWQQYMQNSLGCRIPNPVYKNQELGICTDFNPETGEFIYLIGMEVEEGSVTPEGMVYRSIPEEEYAVFTTPKANDQTFSLTIQTTWNKIFTEWFPKTGYEHAGTTEFELYDQRCHGSEKK